MHAQATRKAVGQGFTKRRLGLEPLESRHLLSAGSVGVSVTAGVLTLTGDANDDAMQISGVTSDSGTFKIQGLRGTLINGVANGSVTETGVTSIATSGWGNGRDFLGFTDNNATGLAGGLSITMGNGNDQVVLGKDGDAGHGHGPSNNTTTQVNGDVQVTLGSGNDEVDVKNFSVTTTQGFLVTMGSGNDKFDAENVTVSATGVAPIAGDQGFGVQMGDGNDSVELDNINVTADGTVTGRQGLGFLLGNGNNRFQASGISVSLSGAVAGLQGFGVMMGNGNDNVSIDDADITGGQGFAISLGNGNNNVNLGGDGGGNSWCGDNRRNAAGGITVSGSALVSLGTGRDNVNIDDMTVDGDLNIQKTTAGGSGATIQLKGVTVDGALNIDTSGDTAHDSVTLGAGDRWEHGSWHRGNSSANANLNTFNTANVTMGGQNTLKVNNSTITTANFDGGTPGLNTYVQGKNVTITTLNKTNFT